MSFISSTCIFGCSLSITLKLTIRICQFLGRKLYIIERGKRNGVREPKVLKREN